MFNRKKGNTPEIDFLTESQLEQLRLVRENVESKLAYKQSVILVTSPGGVTLQPLITANLAAVMAEQRKRVLAVDANVRNPLLHTYFSLPNHFGLGDCLQRSGGMRENVTQTFLSNLYLLPAGTSGSAPHHIFTADTVRREAHEWKRFFDLVLINSPDWLTSPESRTLAGICDGMIIVAKEGMTSKKELYAFKSESERAGHSILGVIYLAD